MSGNLTPNYFAPASPNNWIYNRFRIPKKPPVEDTVSQPGRLCWGSVGALPTAEPAPMVGFETVADQTHTEISRKTEPVRIQNPNDPTQWIDADRAKEIFFRTAKLGSFPGFNTAGTTADFGDFAPTPIELSSFKPLGTEQDSGHLLVKFTNKDPNNL